MKILAIADRPPRESIAKIIKEQPIDVICTLGDLDFFSLADLENISNIPKIGVYGNHCSGKYFEPLGIKNMHLATWECEGILFGGFEGSVRYKSNPDAKMYTQEEATKMFENFPRVDVFISHCPPYGINDEPNDLSHQGFQALRNYLEDKKPKYLFHGHTYPINDQLVTKFIETEIVYVYRDKVIDIEF
jgi:uncharacterized protein